MNAHVPPTERPDSPPVELGRYEVDGTERVLIGRRIRGVVRIFDAPAAGGARYLVDSGIESKSELAALVADYKLQAAALGRCPMQPGQMAELMGIGG